MGRPRLFKNKEQHIQHQREYQREYRRRQRQQMTDAKRQEWRKRRNKNDTRSSQQLSDSQREEQPGDSQREQPNNSQKEKSQQITHQPTESLETFPEVYAATIRDLEQLVALDDICLEVGLDSELRSGIGTGSSGAAGVMQLVCNLISTVHNSNGSNTVQQLTYAEILQRSELLQNALTTAFECAGRLMRRCTDANDVSSPFLPAMLIFMEWLACRKEITISSEVDEKQANARHFFWKQCVELLNKLFGSKDLNASAAFSSVDNPEMTTEDDITFWEDLELQGLVPLVPAQGGLDYSITPARVGLRDKKEQQVRVEQLLAAGKAIGIAFVGTGRGIAYDEETGKFYLAGELKGRNMNDNKTSVNGQIIAKEVAESNQDISLIPNIRYVGEIIAKEVAESNQDVSLIPNIRYVGEFKEYKVAMTDACSKSVNGDEDDEEYIVFKPVPKDVSAMNTMCISSGKESGEVSFNAPNVSVSYTSTAFQGKIALDKLEMSSISKEYPLGSVSHGLIQFPTCSFSDFHPDTLLQGDGVALDHAVTLGQAVTGIHSAASNSMHSLVGTTVSSVIPSPGDVSPACQGELQLNRQNSIGGPLPAFQNHDMMLKGGMGNSKINSPGIIGQQKHTDKSLSYWNTQTDVPSLAGLSGLSINDSVSSQAACEKYGMASNFTGPTFQSNINQHSGIPSSFCTDSPFSVARPHPSAPLLPEENNIISSRNISSSMQYGNLAGNVSTEAKGINSAFTMQLECSDVGKSSLKTFAPISQPVAKEDPGRSWMGPSAIGPPPGFGSTQFMSEQSDEDAWLDGLLSGIPGMDSESWGLPMHSSDNGVWTLSDKLPFSPDSTGFPSPGMGLSGFCHADDQQQKQTLDLGSIEQLLQDQQNKWFDYGMESKPLQFGTLQSLYEAQQQSESHKQLLLLQQKQQEWYRQYHMGGPFAS